MDHISLASMKLSKFPNIINLAPEVTCLTDLNISRNNLFNGDEVFEVNSLKITVDLPALTIVLLGSFYLDTFTEVKYFGKLYQRYVEFARGKFSQYRRIANGR
jgi:hypothetical protein